MIAWLEKNAPGYGDLSPEERDAMMYFSLLWTVFEARALGTHGSAAAIRALIQSWDADGRLPGDAFDIPLGYFRDRYFADGNPTPLFDGLHLRDNDLPELVYAVLNGKDNHSVSKATATLVIVHRYRNNLFHGVKWAYGMRGQRDNFDHASQALMTALDILGPLDAGQPQTQ